MDDHATHERISAVAYELWVVAGCPADQADHFWHLAEQRLAEEVRVAKPEAVAEVPEGTVAQPATKRRAEPDAG
jgi:hypothetical protein